MLAALAPTIEVRTPSPVPRAVAREVQTEPEIAVSSSPAACQALTAGTLAEPMEPARFPNTAFGLSSPNPGVVTVVAHAKPHRVDGFSQTAQLACLAVRGTVIERWRNRNASLREAVVDYVDHVTLGRQKKHSDL